jgi:hypothetical protein
MADASKLGVLTDEVVLRLQRSTADLTGKAVFCHSLQEDFAQITPELCVGNLVIDIRYQ